MQVLYAMAAAYVIIIMTLFFALRAKDKKNYKYNDLKTKHELDVWQNDFFPPDNNKN